MTGSFKEKFFSKSPIVGNKKPTKGDEKPTGENKPLSAKEQFIKSIRTSKPGTPSVDALKNQEEFLDHSFYRQNANNAWGADASTNIELQKKRMKSAVISEGASPRGAAASYKAPVFESGKKYPDGTPVNKDLTQGSIKYNASLNTYKPHALGNSTHDVEHELGHASDRAAELAPNKTKGGMYPEYQGYSDIDIKANSGSESFNDYLSTPTEFRTRLNHVKKLMTKDGFNWNNATGGQINHYIQDKLKLKDPTSNSPNNSARGLKAAQYQELLQFQNYNKDSKSGNQDKKFLEKTFHDLANEPYKPDGSDYWDKFYKQQQS